MNREFPVEAPKLFPQLFLIAICVVLPIFFIIGALLFVGKSEFLWVAALIFLFDAILTYVLLRLMHRLKLAIDQNGLHITATFYKRSETFDQMDLDAARVVNLETDRSYRPGIKTNGFSVPSFMAGHFRVGMKGEKLFCLITRMDRVVHIPLSSGEHLLLCPASPQVFLDTLRRAKSAGF